MELQYRGSGKVYFNEKEYKCDLYYNEKLGGIILKINVKNEKMLGDFLEVPFEIPYLYGQLENGFIFTLLKLNRIGMQDLVSYGMSVYTFNVDYILCGIGGSVKYEQTFCKLEFTLSNIIEWAGESVFAIGENYELSKKKEEIKKEIYTGKDFSINYFVYGSMMPVVDNELLKEHIELKQHGVIEICFKKEEKFMCFYNVFIRLKRLIEIASLKKVNLEKITAYSEEVTEQIEEESIMRPVEVFGRDIQENKHQGYSRSLCWKWISLSELIDKNSFEHYFDKHETIAPIIELFLEPFYVKYSSKTRTFLNIVQALETYHSRFITNSLDVYKSRVEEITKNSPLAYAKELKEFLMAKSKKFITLESRLADLLFAEGKIYFDTGKIKHKDYPSVIAHTRNYYIHYDESIKENYNVLSEDELEIYNRSLLQILEYYILLEIGFSDEDNLKKSLTERWGCISEELELMDLSKSKHNKEKVL